MATKIRSDLFTEVVEKAEKFLADDYRNQVGEVVTDDADALYIEFNDLWRHDRDLADDYIDHCDSFNGAFHKALTNIDLPAEHDFSDVQVRVTDSEEMLERYPVDELQAHQLGQFVAVEGQLSKVTGLSYRFKEAAFECQRCGTLTYIPQPRTGFQEPVQCQGCERKGPFEVNMQQSELVDQRKLKLESPPEDRLHGGGESITAFVEEDLCHVGGEHGLADRAGERVVILGKFDGETRQLKSSSRPEIDGFLIAESVVFIEQKLDDITVDETLPQIKEFASGKHGDPIDLLKASLVPRIERTEQINRILEAAIAWLFNSYRIDRPGGDQIRGDLHMALIGDPSTAKSTILTDLARIAPKAVHRSGGSISKVGLTAAAQQEEFAGKVEWTLEPGVLPRANRGHCLIDEVDEVLDERSKAIHDALEGEQMVKVDKAGISANLPTRTALCVSGNPKAGRFNPYEAIAPQLDMDPALISRMDILLPITDELDKEIDTKIADTVLESYQELSRAEVADLKGEAPPEQKKTKRPIPIDVFRDWVHHARQECFPLLTEEAAGLLKETYLEVRNINGGYDSVNDDVTIPATSRSLEAGIRLSTGYARVELSETVEKRHVERATGILKTSIGLNYNSQAGQFDADSTEGRADLSQQELTDLIWGAVRELEGEYENGVPRDVLLNTVANRGAKRERAGHRITRMLRNKGGIYEPKNEHYRTE